MNDLMFFDRAWDEYLEFQSSDRKKYKRINLLIQDIRRSPFQGIGKPEPLREDLSGCWSRRIDEEDRIVYRVDGGTIVIVQCGSHYRDK